MAYFTDLVRGYRRFRSEHWAKERARWADLRQSQSPRVMVIACSDSRVDPSMVFDTSPGEIFVLRNIANLVPPFETDGSRHGVSAAIEFAVTQLKVAEIVVMGHGACGGVKAALTQGFDGKAPGEGGFIHHWIDVLDDARARVIEAHGMGDDAVHALELEGIRTSLANLRTFPFVRAAEAAGTLTLHGAYFAIADGELHIMDDDGNFEPAGH
ncbi:MAG: carbonic anhydrase [Sphingomonas sp.]|jgi:carbonic anhydrase|uniref:carbonic anhydrase n=1 Tax=Sphingomonas sp. TaxID=28214 RepID=UPI000DB387ED|nr:carbonate dehydratase [Zymomonas sp.]MBA4041442.1 carbonate dehydratase [Sphingobium sp.]MBA4772512.1 carbonic anhydrase [Sphingomonas sp.]PZP12240.1 MAG: carbonate dehydratase [Sphingomonas hengshuiensis]